ncbi:PAS domain-containing sensor histidine kinase [Rhizobium sp. BK251]|uniref:PAS domain-containing sensor histidine kinase n=1 Tax=Rhizobium sp. BK251 TaxID=2512125 RepID=UPI0010DD79A9|nr:PAS domain-containing sensor histidine kinase [Rhizobium sp. BK251]TCL75506.1 phospho-acceptor domain-containing protein [Rhizobium sp. BK251]
MFLSPRESDLVSMPETCGVRYGATLLVVAATLPVAITLDHHGIPTAFAVVLLAVIFSVWRFGTGPGLLAAILAIFSVRFFFLMPSQTIDPRLLDDEALRRFLLYVEVILLLWLLASAQRRGQEKLKRSEAYLADAQALSRTGSVSFIVPEGEVFWSAEIYRIFGFGSQVSPAVQSMLDRVHADDMIRARRGFYYLAEPREAIELEHRIVTPDGCTKHLRIYGKAVRQRDGRIRVSAAMMDVSESKRMSESLLKAQAELAHVTRLTTMGELVASISHEVNQPLGAMKLSAQAGLRWLDRESPDLERVGASLNRVVDNANRAEDLILKLRNMAKKHEIEAVPLNLNRIATDVIELLRGEANERDVTCVVDPEPDLKLVDGDEIQLQQILVNFVMNGFDAMAGAEHREITIRSRNGADSVVLDVTDSGPGIPENLKDRLFDAFFTTKAHGMGMGLSICRSIVEAHGGTIDAFNNEDRGATFRISLPLSEET